MKITPINNKINKSFRSAAISINALSDTHGNLKDANKALEELRLRQDCFCEEEKGRHNVIAVCGDWFMNGAQKGYLSNPEKPLAKFQLNILNEFIKRIKGIAKNTTAIFTPGNHEFDGGIPLLDEVLSEINADILMSNIDIENSPAFLKSGDKIMNEKIIEIDDDKDPNIKHKVLFLGIIPVNMQAYQKNLEGVTITDNVNKPQANVQEEDYKKTLEECKQRISDFKKDNPNGIVVLLSHTGVGFADNIAEKSTVDLIFDGHEHKDETRLVNGTPIIALSKNFEKIVNAKIDIDDDGKKSNIIFKSFSPLSNNTKGPLARLFKHMFSKDLEKKYYISAGIEDLKELSIDEVRSKNNYLANFITDSILEELRKKNPQVNFLALNSSAIRHPLKISEKPAISAFDIMNVLSGIRDDEAQIMLTKVTGRELAEIVADNYMFNKQDPDKNTIMHYSGLITKRDEIINAVIAGNDIEKVTSCIIDTQTQKPIEPDKEYIIANAEKYFIKSKNPFIQSLKSRSEYINETITGLFCQHFKNSNGKLFAKCDERIE